VYVARRGTRDVAPFVIVPFQEDTMFDAGLTSIDEFAAGETRAWPIRHGEQTNHHNRPTSIMAISQVSK
jgi:hypothetical protein